MARGGYLGGSTVIHAGSSWFTYGASEPEKTTNPKRPGRRERATLKAATPERLAIAVREASVAMAAFEAAARQAKRAAEVATAAKRDAEEKAHLVEQLQAALAAKSERAASVGVKSRRANAGAKVNRPPLSAAELEAAHLEREARARAKKNAASHSKTVLVARREQGREVVVRVGLIPPAQSE